MKTNNLKEELTSGQHEYDSVTCIIVGKGGTGVAIDFIFNVNNSNKPKHCCALCDLFSTKSNHNSIIDGVKLNLIHCV